MTEFTHVAGWTLVSFLWQGALIAAAAAVALRLASRAAASTRYAIACAALATMLAAPVTTIWWLQGAGSGCPDRRSEPRPSQARWRSSDGSANPIVRPMTAVIPADATRWFPLLVAVWLIGVAALTARTAWGWLRIRQLHHGALAAPSSRWQATANRLAASSASTAACTSRIAIAWTRPP